MSERPMLCGNCKASIPTLKVRLDRVNHGLTQIPIYFETMGAAFTAVENVLRANGFECDWPVVSSHPDSLHFEVGEGKWLTFSWYRMEATGRYEVTAYVN